MLRLSLKTIDAVICWLKVEENFTNEEIDKLKELVSEILECLFRINGSLEV